MSPAAVALLVVVGLPLVLGVQISVSTWSGAGPMTFVGFANYVSAFQDPAVLRSIGVTVLFAVATAMGILVVATVLAAAVSRGIRGARFYKVVWFLPGVAPLIASAMFWRQAMQPETGAVNYLLGVVGLGDGHAWLGDPAVALYPLIAVAVWASAGFAFLLILGAMEQVPVECYESSALDGAGPIRQFFTMTLPLIMPVLATVALLQLIGAANNFGIVWAMTQGGPGDATAILPALVYREAFVSGRFGTASAIAVAAGIVLVVIGLVGLRVSRSRTGGT